MTSTRKIKKKLNRWNRYNDHYMLPGVVATPGWERAWNRWCRAKVWRNYSADADVQDMSE